jgi:DNA-binding transcriptional LysR family regulator
MLAEAEQAEALVAQAQPHGRIRFSCPTGMVAPITGIGASILAKYPKVRLQLAATDRGVDLIEERVDLALRVRSGLSSEAELTMRSLGSSNGVVCRGSSTLSSRPGAGWHQPFGRSSTI